MERTEDRIVQTEQPSGSSAEPLKAEIIATIASRRFGDASVRLAAARAAYPTDPWFALKAAEVFGMLGGLEKLRSDVVARDRAKEIAREFEKSVAACRDAIGLGMNDWSVYFYLGQAYQMLGRFPEAMDALKVANQAKPQDLQVRSQLLTAVVSAGGIAAGRKLYDEYATSEVELIAAWARLLFEAGETEEVDRLGLRYRCARLSSVTDWAERAGVKLDFVGDVEDIPVEDPDLIGGPLVERFRGSVRSYRPYVCTVPDALVLSKSDMVLTADAAALNDVAADAKYGRFIEFYHDQAVVRRRNDRMLLDPGRFRINELDEGIMLSGGASHHFGHWVPEFLCRLAFLVHHPDFAKLPIIVDEGMPTSHVDYLRLLAANEIVQLPKQSGFRCRRLVVAPPPTFFPVHWSADHDIPEHEQGPYSPRCLRFLQARVAARLHPSGVRHRRIYLSRGRRRWRHLVNDEEIAAHLRTEGFETVFPEDLSFVEQVRLFQDAEAIVAPSGSCLVNLIFADPAVKLLVLNQPYTFSLNGFYGPMRALGYDPTFVCGTEGDHSDKQADFSVPIWRIQEGLRQTASAAAD